MNISLRPVDRDNWERVIDLELKPGQEKFVALNVESIAESHFYDYYVNLAVYLDETPVGFLQYHPMEPEGTPGEYFISQFMLDANYQGKGIGTKATELILQLLSAKPDCKVISIVYVEGHDVMRDFYQRFGFRVVDCLEVEGVVMELEVTKEKI